MGALIFQDSKVLLVQRGRPPLVGLWSLPGGIVETGERLEDAIVREVFEESGLQVSVGSIATVFERIMHDPALKCEYHYVLVDFCCSRVSGILRAGDDSRKVEWFDIDSLDGLDLTEGTSEVIRASFYSRVTQPAVTRP